MKNTTSRKIIRKTHLWQKVVVGITMLIMLGVVCIAVFFIFSGKRIVYQSETSRVPMSAEVVNENQFPIGVNPTKKEIVENPIVDIYFERHISKNSGGESRVAWLERAIGKLALMSWYQNLASVSSRILVIRSGERMEEVAHNFAKILKWDSTEKDTFLKYIQESEPSIPDGKFFPGTYTVPREAPPLDVAKLVLDRFTTEVLTRYDEDIARIVPLEDALIIASLLEREAYDFTDMRHIAGVIWNRLFIDMRLQLDATLQYAKGSKPTEPWWPKVRPQDKYIDSPYNTYEHKGLPPTPIANPSLEAILAALNPSKTDCMYYFHDARAGFHCSKTYEEHVALLKQYYGRGK